MTVPFEPNKIADVTPQKTLIDIMVNVIVPRYPDTDGLQERLKASAQQWRLPYWDWAQKKKINTEDNNEEGRLRVPRIVRDKEIYITISSGFTKVRNPMASFVMPDKKRMGDYGVHHYSTNIKSEKFDYNPPVSPLHIVVQPGLIFKSLRTLMARAGGLMCLSLTAPHARLNSLKVVSITRKSRQRL
jgi:Common central domain of tyrosinase